MTEFSFGHIFDSATAFKIIDGRLLPVELALAEETPIGIQYNSIPHATLMASPEFVEDLVVGFSITDQICSFDEITSVEVRAQEGVITANVYLVPTAFARFLKLRQETVRRSYTSCGVCGVQAPDNLPPVKEVSEAVYRIEAMRCALAELPSQQVGNKVAGTLHAAAWASPEGHLGLLREDVGRHNAMDKLIGAMAMKSLLGSPGFCVATSRCSYEMVQKATAAGFSQLVCISAPTALAVRLARQAGLRLIALARTDSQILYAGSELNDHGSGCP